METLDKISIIVPVFNVESFLSECIDSICRQTYRNLEIILVDDGSTDRSGSICDEYALKDNRIIVIHQKNGGISNARNNTLKMATGEYIGFVDSDDVIHSRMFEFLHDALVETNASVSICHEIAFRDNDTVAFNDYSTYTIERLEDQIQLFSHMADEWTGPINWIWNKLYRKSDFSGLKFFEGKRMEDVRFSSEYISRIQNGVWIKECLYGYRQRTGSTMNSNDLRIPTEYTEALMYQRSFIYKTENVNLINKFDEYILKKIPKLRCELASYKGNTKNGEKYIKEMYKKIYHDFDKSATSFKNRLKFFMARYMFSIYKVLYKIV